MPKANSTKLNGNDAGMNFEAQLCAAADQMRGHIFAGKLKQLLFSCCYTIFVFLEEFLKEHDGHVGNIAVYGHDELMRGQRRFGLPTEGSRMSTRRRANPSCHKIWRIARINLSIRGIEADFGPAYAGKQFGVRTAPLKYVRPAKRHSALQL